MYQLLKGPFTLSENNLLYWPGHNENNHLINRNGPKLDKPIAMYPKHS